MIRRLLPFFILPFLFSCVAQDKSSECELIAHAGGEIDGYVYTNSLEALQQAVEKGYMYIELDLQMTEDSVLVAAHSWEEFNSMTGNSHRGDSAMLSEQFVGQQIHGRYTPLTAGMINDFFMQNTTLYLVTDKISDPEVLKQYFPDLKQRMVVEAFSYEHYEQLVDEGYFRVLYSCMADDFSTTITKNLLFASLFPGKRIEWIALHTNGFDNPVYDILNSMCRFNIALFTVDDYNELSQQQLERVQMIYTNRLLPGQSYN